LTQVSDKSVSIQIQQQDLNFLCTSGYLTQMPKEDYDRTVTEVSDLSKMNEDLQSQTDQERTDMAALAQDERKSHSVLFHFEGKDKKQAVLTREESEKNVVSKEEADIAAKDSLIASLVQKKSMLDRMIPYNGQYLSLTGTGVVALNDLNVRNYRVSDSEFSDFVQ